MGKLLLFHELFLSMPGMQKYHVPKHIPFINYSCSYYRFIIEYCCRYFKSFMEPLYYKRRYEQKAERLRVDVKEQTEICDTTVGANRRDI